MNKSAKTLDELAFIFSDLCKASSDRSGMSDKPHAIGPTGCPTQKTAVGQVGHTGDEKYKVPDMVRPSKARSDSRNPTYLCALPDMPDLSDKKQVMLKKQKGEATAPRPVEFAERAATLEYDGGLGRDEAEQTAALELGFANPVAVYSATLASWQHHLQHIGEITTTRRSKEIIGDGQAFLEEWGLTALQMGWDEQDLFRCTAHDLEAVGMYSGFGKHPQLQRLGLIFLLHGGRVELMTRESATIRTVGGQKQSFQRYGPGHNQGGPIWEVICNGQ